MINADKKILMISPFALPNLGGVESHIDKLINYATQKGYYIVLITYQPLTHKTKGPNHEIHESYEIYRTTWFGMGLFHKLENYFYLVLPYLFPGLFAKSLYFYLRHHKEVSCIHAHGLAAALVAYFLSKIHKKKIIVSTHAVYNFSKRPTLSFLTRILLDSFDTILAVSEVSKNEINNMGINGNKVMVHKNWIDTTRFKPIDRNKARRLLNITENSTNFLFVGRLLEIKGVKIFTDAAIKLPQYNFHIVGTGPLEGLASEAANRHQNLFYYGSLMQTDPHQLKKLISLYNASNALISPYTYEEGFSTILIEALACGTPLIITKRGSPPTFIDEKFYIPLPIDVNADILASTIKSSLATINKLDRKSIREFAKDNFGEKNADVILNTYNS